MAVTNLFADCKLLFCLKLCSSALNHVKSACVAVFIDNLVIKNNVLVFKDAAGTAAETVECIGRVGLLKSIVKTADNIVSAGCLSA